MVHILVAKNTTTISTGGQSLDVEPLLLSLQVSKTERVSVEPPFCLTSRMASRASGQAREHPRSTARSIFIEKTHEIELYIYIYIYLCIYIYRLIAYPVLNARVTERGGLLIRCSEPSFRSRCSAKCRSDVPGQCCRAWYL